MINKFIVVSSLFLISGAVLAGGYITDVNNSCQVWNPYPSPNESIKYTGECPNGKATGKGVVLWYLNSKPNSRDEGDYSQGKLNGKGTSYNNAGLSYEGEYENSIKQGNGTLTWKNGSSYIGELQGGKFHGFGRLSLMKEDQGIALFGKNGNAKGQYVGGQYIVQGLFENGMFIMACNSKSACDKLKTK